MLSALFRCAGFGAAFALGATPISATAESVYASLRGGKSPPPSSNIDMSSVRSVEFGESYAFAGAIGYIFADVPAPSLRLRPELEIAYRRNNVDSLRADIVSFLPIVATFSVDGQVNMLTGFANLWLDYRIPDSRIIPYVGGGLGPTRVWLNDVTPSNIAEIDEAQTAASGQLGAGVAYRLTDRVNVTVDYRFTATGSFETNLTTNTFSVGFRYGF